MSNKPCWDRLNQMPPGRSFEAYHLTDATSQPKVIHSHEYYELYFFLRGRIRIIIEDVDICPQRGELLLFPPHCMHRNIHLDADEPYERFCLFVTREFLQGVAGEGYALQVELDRLIAERGCHFRSRTGMSPTQFSRKWRSRAGTRCPAPKNTKEPVLSEKGTGRALCCLISP